VQAVRRVAIRKNPFRLSFIEEWGKVPWSHLLWPRGKMFHAALLHRHWLQAPIEIQREGGDQNMISKIPIDLENVKKEDLDKEILRAGIIAELDAINLYEQMAAMTKNNHIKKILLDIAKEEKTHVGEFLTLLLGKDREQGVELEKGKEEIEELIGK
jgi:hypothetical protein